MNTALPKTRRLIAGQPILSELYKLISIMVGAIIFAIGLEGFLIPNNFLDGGVVGIAIIVTHSVNFPMGVFIAVLNLPFLLLAWRKIGRRSALRSGVGIATLSIATIVLHHMAAITDESWLALICGGAMIALGIGVALRHGGALDGTEVLATILASNSKYTVGQIILCINLAIFTIAGFVISWESALLSAVLFYVVVKDLVDKIAHGESGASKAQIVTKNPDELAACVAAHLHRPILVAEHRRWTPEGRGDIVWVITVTCTAMEEATLVEEVARIDPKASVTFADVASLHGPIAEAVSHA